jgi:hypothetical protein
MAARAPALAAPVRKLRREKFVDSFMDPPSIVQALLKAGLCLAAYRLRKVVIN